ncbi:TetR/AcrR family transcriptional regulator [Leifsonia poae]|uniref:TetR/AcrR family transcriptional regulator n=1 Tax=Leifsonia poae TaxID=110933 RepID=UPI003D6820E6
MAGTRERALDAAVEVLGTEGVRALSHARVDAAAGLPAGSTSNWFRTRRALLGGVVDWIAESERADYSASDVPLAPGEAGLIDGLSALIELLTGPFAVRTRARYALFLELAADPELGATLRSQRREFEGFTEQLVAQAGIPDPTPATRALMALGDGLILHRLTVDPELAVRPTIERTVRALGRQL